MPEIIDTICITVLRVNHRLANITPSQRQIQIKMILIQGWINIILETLFTWDSVQSQPVIQSNEIRCILMKIRFIHLLKAVFILQFHEFSFECYLY